MGLSNIFEKTSHNPYLGILSGKGQSKVWSAKCKLTDFDDEFCFRIWGDKNDLMPHQETVVREFFANLDEIIDMATLSMLKFWQDIDFLQDYFPKVA